jgi:hypothetical protein
LIIELLFSNARAMISLATSIARFDAPGSTS